MAKALPPLAWFRAFEAAARRLSFTAAAEEIGMTQSAVSQHVKALETSLGTALFVRRPRGLTLTDDGRKLLPQVGSALETLTQAARAFDQLPKRNILTVAASVSVTQWVLSPLLGGFLAHHPDIRLRFLSTIWPDEAYRVRANVEIRFGSQKQVGAGGRLLEPSGLVALKAPQLLGPLEELPLIESVGISDGWAAWGAAAGLDVAPRIFVDNYGAALNFAVQGHGVALVSEVLAQPALQTGVLVRAHEAVLPSKEGYYLWHDPSTPVAAEFCDWILQALAGCPEEGAGAV